MASLASLATKCRFAVLEISDDDKEEDESEQNEASRSRKNVQKGGKTGQQHEPNNTVGAAKAVKKSKKKKHKSKGGATEATGGPKIPPKDEEWSSWKARDEQFVLSQFHKDLQAALEESKKENVAVVKNEKFKAQVDGLEAISMTGNGTEQKKKKEKPVVMSLDEFVSGAGAGKVDLSNEKYLHQGGTSRMMTLDSFAVKNTEEEAEGSSWFLMNGSSIVPAPDTPCQEPHDEKPSEIPKAKRSTRKREKSKSEEDPAKENSEKLVAASKEDQLKREEMQAQAEIVLVQEELVKKNAMFEKLKKAFKKQNEASEELKKELGQVKKRNKQLCFILSQAEMKEKSELVMQIEELSEVREQIVQLHAELEQERSKSSALKSELAKHQGRKRLDSTS